MGSKRKSPFPLLTSEAVKKYSSLNPDSPEGRLILRMHFISQSAPDSRCKLRKPGKFPQFPQNKFTCLSLLYLISGMYRIRKKNRKEAKGRPRIKSSSISGDLQFRSYPNRQISTFFQSQTHSSSCLRYTYPGHWNNNRPSPMKDPSSYVLPSL